MLLLLCLVANFSTDYRNFIASPRSESIFVGLTRGEIRLLDFKDHPEILWFWRNSTECPEADSLLKNSLSGRHFYLSALLRWEARQQDDPERALQKLRLAIHFDSTAVENAVSLISLYARQRRYGRMTELLNLPLLGNLRNQIFFITNVFIGLTLIIFLTGCAYILIKIIFYLPVLSHRLDPLRHTPVKNILPLVIILLPLLVFRHLYVLYAVYGLVLAFIGLRREKNWLRLNIILLAIMFIISFPMSNLTDFLNGRSRTYQLYRIAEFGGDPKIMSGLPEQKELLAYTLKKQGMIDDALSLYEELYFQGHRRFEVLNNLANIYALIEEDARAESLYLQAARFNRPEPYFNLALLKLKNIEYLESSKYMEEARRLGFASLSKSPIDIGPVNRDYYASLLDRHDLKTPLFNPLLFFPLALVFIASFLPARLTPPWLCGICGQPICPGCSVAEDHDALCFECQAKMKNSGGDEDLRDALRRRSNILSQVLTVLLNLILPGTGLIYLGKNFAGLIIVAIAAASWVPLLFRPFFVKPAGWIALPLGHALTLPAVIVLAAAYLLSFLLMLETYAARRRSQEF